VLLLVRWGRTVGASGELALLVRPERTTGAAAALLLRLVVLKNAGELRGLFSRGGRACTPVMPSERVKSEVGDGGLNSASELAVALLRASGGSGAWPVGGEDGGGGLR
jgi:hypothetical protein